MTSVSPQGMDIEDRRRWKRLGGIFDAACPVVPGVYAGSPIEYAVGQTISTWSIFGHIRPTFTLPVYAAHEGSSVNEVERLKRWVDRRGVRGVSLLSSACYAIGWNLSTRDSESTLDNIVEAWNGPVDKTVVRVDYF